MNVHLLVFHHAIQRVIAIRVSTGITMRRAIAVPFGVHGDIRQRCARRVGHTPADRAAQFKSEVDAADIHHTVGQGQASRILVAGLFLPELTVIIERSAALDAHILSCLDRKRSIQRDRVNLIISSGIGADRAPGGAVPGADADVRQRHARRVFDHAQDDTAALHGEVDARAVGGGAGQGDRRGVLLIDGLLPVFRHPQRLVARAERVATHDGVGSVERNLGDGVAAIAVGAGAAIRAQHAHRHQRQRDIRPLATDNAADRAG